LDFSKLVIPQIAENITFYTVAIILAVNNFGIASFTWAVIARGLVGLAIIYTLSPWMPQFGIDKKSFKSLTSFGIPFQINSVLALIKDDLLTIFLGKILTLTQIGYVGWAQKWAFTPLRFFMDSVNKITFPAYSRLQEHRKELAAAIEKSIFFVAYFVYPSVFGMTAIVGDLIDLVPRYQKWEPALPLLYLFFINALFSAVSTTLTNTLFAIGRAKIVLKLMFFWTSVTWLLTYPLVLTFGYIGVAVASAIVSITSIVTLYFVKKEIDIKVAKNIIGPLSISIFMYIIVTATLNILPKSFISVFIAIIIGVSSYFVMSLVIFKNHIVSDAKSILKALIIKK
jgi:O-antigen/teichoic acid export membrane protein